MYLAIDIGNTRQKAAVFSSEGEQLAVVSEQLLPTETITQLIEEYKVTHSILSSVGAERTDIQQLLAERTLLTDFTHTTPLPIQIDYQTPQTLGLDRIASAVAAHSFFTHENVLAIQAGTCLVTDFVTADGHYLGGSISPGLDMRLAALHHFTRHLPQVERQPVGKLTGTTTEESYVLAIQCGGCMVTARQLQNRLRSVTEAGVPVVNYGMAIAWLTGIYQRALKPLLEK